MDETNRRSWIEALLVSLLLHFILFAVLAYKTEIFTRHLISLGDKEEVVPVDISRMNEPQIVNVDYDSKEAFNKTAKYLSKANRRVEEETKASAWGSPKNVRPISLISKSLQDYKKEAIESYLKKKAKISADEKGMEKIENREKERTRQNRKFSPVQPQGSVSQESTTFDYLPNVKAGHDTILNTAEFVYYSFYRRVEESIVPVWNTRINEFLTEAASSTNRVVIKKGEYITDVEAVLDRLGEIRTVKIIRSSGIQGIDNAPGLAFMDASPFVNPPQGMIGPDGLVRMKWRFVVSLVDQFNFGVKQLDPPIR